MTGPAASGETAPPLAPGLVTVDRGEWKGGGSPGAGTFRRWKRARPLASRDPINTRVPRERPREGRGARRPSRWLSASRVTASGSPAGAFPCSGTKRLGGSGAVRRRPRCARDSSSQGAPPAAPLPPLPAAQGKPPRLLPPQGLFSSRQRLCFGSAAAWRRFPPGWSARCPWLFCGTPGARIGDLGARPASRVL